jgi:hypothetical protein
MDLEGGSPLQGPRATFSLLGFSRYSRSDKLKFVDVDQVPFLFVFHNCFITVSLVCCCLFVHRDDAALHRPSSLLLIPI